jgi:hypothetical protein
MTEETQQPTLNVSEMLKMTGANTAEFMSQVAAHVDKLEETIVQLTNRITELESQK